MEKERVSGHSMNVPYTQHMYNVSAVCTFVGMCTPCLCTVCTVQVTVHKCCVCVCVCECVCAHARTFASASVPNTPGRSVLAYRPQLEPMALAKVVAILRVVVTWEEGREGKRAYIIVQMYKCTCTSQNYPPPSNQLSSLCYRRDPGLAAEQAPLHPPSHTCMCTGTRTYNLKSMQSSPVVPQPQLQLQFTGSHQVLVGVPQSPFERSREVSLGWLNELSSSEYLCHLLQCLTPHLPVLVTEVTHIRGSDLGTGGGGGGGKGGGEGKGGEGEGRGRGRGEEGEGRGRRGEGGEGEGRGRGRGEGGGGEREGRGGEGEGEGERGRGGGGKQNEGKEWGTVTVHKYTRACRGWGLVYKPDTTHSVLNLHTLYTHAYSTYCRAYVWITSYRLLHTVTCTYYVHRYYIHALPLFHAHLMSTLGIRSASDIWGSFPPAPPTAPSASSSPSSSSASSSSVLQFGPRTGAGGASSDA